VLLWPSVSLAAAALAPVVDDVAVCARADDAAAMNATASRTLAPRSSDQGINL
jgi:hypothetical protein